MELGNWPKFQKLHLYSLSTPGGRNWASFPSTGSGFQDRADFQSCHIWAWNYRSPTKDPEAAYTSILFLAQGVENELIFFSMGSGFQDTGRLSKLPYWAWNKVPVVAHIVPKLPPPPFFPNGPHENMFGIFEINEVMRWCWDECTEWPQNSPNIFEVKSTYLRSSRAPKAQAFICLALCLWVMANFDISAMTCLR